MLRFKSLGSGSSGNAMVVQARCGTQLAHLLIDCGLGIRELDKRLRAAGMTMVYTTHYMEEAAQICGRVAVVDRGRVIAGREWGAPMEVMDVPTGRLDSWDDLLHRANAGDGLLLFEGLNEPPALREPRGQRAIGVVYHPEYEHLGNYVPTALPRRYDALLYLDRTEALRPIPVAVDVDDDAVCSPSSSPPQDTSDTASAAAHSGRHRACRGRAVVLAPVLNAMVVFTGSSWTQLRRRAALRSATGLEPVEVTAVAVAHGPHDDHEGG